MRREKVCSSIAETSIHLHSLQGIALPPHCCAIFPSIVHTPSSAEPRFAAGGSQWSGVATDMHTSLSFIKRTPCSVLINTTSSSNLTSLLHQPVQIPAPWQISTVLLHNQAERQRLALLQLSFNSTTTESRARLSRVDRLTHPSCLRRGHLPLRPCLLLLLPRRAPIPRRPIHQSSSSNSNSSRKQVTVQMMTTRRNRDQARLVMRVEGRSASVSGEWSA